MKLAKLTEGGPEIYAAVQGEGKTVGKPVIFVRLAGCNLSCHFCDSAYTWDYMKGKATINDRVVNITVEDVALKISELFKKHKHKNVIFTGGEPLIQQADIKKVIELIKPDHVELETNGTLLVTTDLVPFINQVNCSPKLASSGNKNSLIPEIAAFLNEDFKDKVIFKFVVSSVRKDMKEIRDWQKMSKIKNNQIYLMPEGITREKIIEGTQKIEQICIEKGYNLSTRLHILIHGNKRCI